MAEQIERESYKGVKERLRNFEVKPEQISSTKPSQDNRINHENLVKPKPLSKPPKTIIGNENFDKCLNRDKTDFNDVKNTPIDKLKQPLLPALPNRASSRENTTTPLVHILPPKPMQKQDGSICNERNFGSKPDIGQPPKVVCPPPRIETLLKEKVIYPPIPDPILKRNDRPDPKFEKKIPDPPFIQIKQDQIKNDASKQFPIGLPPPPLPHVLNEVVNPPNPDPILKTNEKAEPKFEKKIPEPPFIQIKRDQSKFNALKLLPTEFPPPPLPPLVPQVPTKVATNFSTPVCVPPPPPPPPPPQIKSKLDNNDDETVRPPVPPPPPQSIKKSVQSNLLIGWVKNATNNKNNVTNDPEPIRAVNKIIPDNKNPPPVTVAPPSRDTLMKGTTNLKIRDSVEETYDDDDDLLHYPWYFDGTREEASQMMKLSQKNGSYMVRTSENNQYVLMVKVDHETVKKFKIQRHKDGWVLGDPNDNKKIHPNVSSLMEFYCENGIRHGNNQLLLKEPANKVR